MIQEEKQMYNSLYYKNHEEASHSLYGRHRDEMALL